MCGWGARSARSARFSCLLTLRELGILHTAVARPERARRPRPQARRLSTLKAHRPRASRRSPTRAPWCHAPRRRFLSLARSAGEDFSGRAHGAPPSSGPFLPNDRTYAAYCSALSLRAHPIRYSGRRTVLSPRSSQDAAMALEAAAQNSQRPQRLQRPMRRSRAPALLHRVPLERMPSVVPPSPCFPFLHVDSLSPLPRAG